MYRVIVPLIFVLSGAAAAAPEAPSGDLLVRFAGTWSCKGSFAAI
jgi:hypothetical protein